MGSRRGGAYLHRGVRHTRQRIIAHERFPSPIRIPPSDDIAESVRLLWYWADVVRGLSLAASEASASTSAVARLDGKQRSIYLPDWGQPALAQLETAGVQHLRHGVPT